MGLRSHGQGAPFLSAARSSQLSGDGAAGILLARNWAEGRRREPDGPVFEVTVQRVFSASHQLRLPNGSFEPLHAHDWRVRITCAGPKLSDAGLLVDFGPLRARLDDVLDELRGRNLNELAEFATTNPTAEHIAVYVARRLAARLPAWPPLRCVEVEEEPGCAARYYPPSDECPR
jgi:6-pyruvoyltetrahydropterin/6-carboxytetrahydropterin synthase